MTDELPTVSVIVPVHNGADTIHACLESLLALDYPADRLEIAAVENGSTDGTAEVIRRYPVRLLRGPLGLARARNYGVAQTGGEIVAFTDTDCLAHPGWLRALVAAFAEPGVAGVGGAIIAHAHPGRSDVERFSDDKVPMVNFLSGRSEYLPHLCGANLAYRRDVLQHHGGFDERLVVAEDVDLSWRVQLAGAAVRYAPEAIVYHRQRTSRRGLMRQHKRYGFSEIVLDTLYRTQPGYPRTRAYQARRIGAQLAALPRYAASAALRRWRRVRGAATAYDAAVPFLCMLVESANILGKLEALIATRGMSDAAPALRTSPARALRWYSPGRD